MAIAYSVLKFLKDKIKCRVIFTIHYHLLFDEFKNCPEIKNYHMTSKIDEANGNLIFLSFKIS